MEGHPGYEDRGAAAARGHADSTDAIRKRAFLLLEGERRSLAAQLCPLWRPGGRYEDLSLVAMLARLERDWLSQPGPHLEGGDHEESDRRSGRRLADWAMPWGAAPRTRLEAYIDRVDGVLDRLGRWLPRSTVAKAEYRARERLAVITRGLREPEPRARAAAAAAQSSATEALRSQRPWRTRVAAIAGLALLAGGVFLLASQDAGPDS